MEVTAQERQQLFAWFEEHMGKERATIMERVLEGGSSLATKADLDEQTGALRHDIDEQTTALRQELGVLRHDLDAQGTELRLELDALRHDLEALEQRMDLKLERMQSNLLRTGGTWLFASQAAVIMAVGVFTALS
jgi:hypothetical protein